jgi:hypothetical protein
MKQFICFILMLVLFISCSSSIEKSDGLQSDTIQQSIKEAYCNYKEQTVSIFMKGNSWIISNVFVDGKVIAIDEQKSIPYSIYGDWFIITRTSEQKIIVSINENLTGKVRKLQVVLADRNFYTYTTIKQETVGDVNL